MAAFGVSTADASALAAAAGAGALVMASQAAGANVKTDAPSAALTAVALLGNATALLVLAMPICTFVIPAWRAKNVQERNPRTFLMMLLGCVLWTVFVVPSLPDSLLVLTVNGAGVAFQSCYLGVFLWYAGAVARRSTFKELLVVLGLSVIMIVLMVVLVEVTHTCNSTFIGVIASGFSTIMFLLGMAIDVAQVKTQRPGEHEMQLAANLLNAIVWIVYGFLCKPSNIYVLVPNITGAACIVVQIIARIIYRQARGPAAAPRAVAAR